LKTLQTKIAIKNSLHKSRHQLLLLCVLNDKLVAGLTGLVPLPHFFQFLCAQFAVSVLRSTQFLKINISQGSVLTRCRSGGNVNNNFVLKFLPSLSVKEFWKSVTV